MEEQKALRYNEGKTDWTLLDWESVKPLAEGMAYGEKKYSKKIPIEQSYLLQILKYSKCQNKEFALSVVNMEKLLPEKDVDVVIQKISPLEESVLNVEKSELLKLKICVWLAMKQKEFQISPKLKKELENMELNIDLSLKILKKKKIEKESEIIIQNTLKEGNELISCQDLKNMELQKIFTRKSVITGVQSAEVKKDYTLITIMKLEDIELYYVENATKELDCLMKTFIFFKKLLNISTHIVDNYFFISGRNNWKNKCDDPNQHIQSAFRHLIAIASGEEIDPESGVRHSGLVMCNMMMYNYHTKPKKKRLREILMQHMYKK